MISRHQAGKPAQITFTLDFHELVTGELRPGAPVIISYDPQRIIPPGDKYLHGDPERPIFAHIQFRADSPVISRSLISPVGKVLTPDIDATGQGSMLLARFDVPADAEQVTLWFIYESDSSGLVCDNDQGLNYQFRFPTRDIQSLDAVVTSDPATQSSEFGIKLSALPSIEAVSIRFRVVNAKDFAKTEVNLKKTGKTDSKGNNIWSLSDVAVPYQAVVRFKIFYWIKDRRYKDDNSSRYFLAPQPEPDKVPPPPPELAEAAKAWK